MACVSRITDETYAQYFGNGYNKFYIEFRCNLPCIRGSILCPKCAAKSDTCKIQSSRKFQHGNMDEPIPDSSHIFGGKWYYQACQKYGVPTEDVVQFAIKHQNQARDGFDPSLYASAEAEAKAEAEAEVKPVSKSKKKNTSPKVVQSNAVQEESKEEAPNVLEPKESRESRESREPKQSRPKKGKTPKIPLNPYSTLVQQVNSLVYKEVSLPTHLENTVEELDTDDCDIEYVSLHPYEVQGTLYFRDNKKNKLYKNVKQKIGEYVGRYDPDKEIIHTDIPDSDDEE